MNKFSLLKHFIQADIFFPNHFRVLAYHQVNCQAGKHIIHPDKFEEQMKWLHVNGYKTINLQDLGQWLQGKKNITRKNILISFDDGYRDNLEIAKPILDKYNFIACVFVAVEYIGKKFFVKSDGVFRDMLSQDELKYLEKSGWDIANHFFSHKKITKMNRAEILLEIKKSKQILTQAVSNDYNINSFASPYNRTGPGMEEVLKNERVNLFFAERGVILQKQEKKHLPRIEISGNMELDEFQARFSFMYNKLKKLFFPLLNFISK